MISDSENIELHTQHSDKKMKGKYVPITMVTSDLQDNSVYDKLYFHKPLNGSSKSSVSNGTSTSTEEASSSGSEGVIVRLGMDENDKSTTRIQFTELETKLFTTLLEVIRENKLKTTLRVAGGWVRDKLRGDNSSDIDIALDDMMGEAFAVFVNKHLEQNHQETHRIGVIQSNPDQSKHLETATVRIFDTWVDFVNLRSETYSDHSRIPIIEIGTPEQDAYRRDLTINSLFYNINENRVEDFTKKGLTDLRCGIIRTPLPPLTTFLDDPLRVLRSIRFATRLFYSIDNELIEAASSQTVADALKSKVSHERIGIELEGMLNGPRPDLALHLIYKLGLFDHVLNVPENVEIKEKDYKLKSTDNLLNMMRFINWGTMDEPVSTRKLRLLASLSLIFHKYTYQNPAKKNKQFPLLQHVMVEYLKFSNKDYDDVMSILEASELLTPLVNQFHQDGTFSRKQVGLVLHKIGGLWKAALAISLISQLPKTNHSQTYPLHDGKEEVGPHSPSFNFNRHPNAHHPPACSETKSIELKYDNFCAMVAQVGLVNVWTIKKLLNGKQVMDLLKRKPGEWLAPVLQDLFEWQLSNPSLGETEAKDYLKQKYLDSTTTTTTAV